MWFARHQYEIAYPYRLNSGLSHPTPSPGPTPMNDSRTKIAITTQTARMAHATIGGATGGDSND